MAKPRFNNFCNVCQDAYSEYKEHILFVRHKKNIKRSKFDKHIRELSDQYRILMGKAFEEDAVDFEEEGETPEMLHPSVERSNYVVLSE